MTNPMRAVFVGDGSLLVRCAQAWREAGQAVVAVASADPAVLAWAREAGLCVEVLDDAPRFEKIAFDFLFSVAHLSRLPALLVARAARQALNFHDGPLPRHAGLNAPAWALMAGEAEHGITWHEITEQLDRGRIAAQVSLPLAPDETAASLNARCYEAGYQAFVSLLPQLAQGAVPLQAQSGEGHWHGRHDRPPLLATLDLRRGADELCALVRALDFGRHANPLALPRLWVGGRLLRVGSARVVDVAGAAQGTPGDGQASAPGTVLACADDMLRVATGQGVLQLEGLKFLDDAPLQPLPPVAAVIAPLPAPQAQALAGAMPRLARGEPHWRQALASLAALPVPRLPYPQAVAPHPDDPAPSSQDGPQHVAHEANPPLRLRLQSTEQGADTLAAFAAWLSALTGQAQVPLLATDAALADAAQGLAPWATAWVPLVLATDGEREVGGLREAARAALAAAHEAGPSTTDLRWRLGRPAPEPPAFAISLGGEAPPAGAGLTLALHAERAGQPLTLQVDLSRHDAGVAQEIARQLDAWLMAFAAAPSGTAVASLSLLPPRDAQRHATLNDTALAVDTAHGIHDAVAVHAEACPDAEALRWRDISLTHAQLQLRVDRLALALRERGVRAGDVVGLCLERSPDLVVAVLAVLRAGAAYLPLDPDYPQARLRFMLEDSGAACVVGDGAAASLLGLDPARVVPPDAAPQSDEYDPPPAVTGQATAYLIYTSGSTGQPKGVLVTHANVLNFFAGMDARVPRPLEGEGGRWLAVTSLSFDISVLELLWTLARGFTVVLPGGPAPAQEPAGPAFSLFYFASGQGGGAAGEEADAYRLLIEGAHFADQHGFAAVWTPERHFHDFGSPYPNPAVTGAALAAITNRVHIRAGSCVLPLHHPLRVAEDWAVVDRLSGGRAGVSFAAGWQPQDFVLAPQAFAARKRALAEGIDTVRRLWRGEAVAFPGPQGEPVAVHTRPRPVQSELPVWLTAAANPETFAQAGQTGCHVLTHLLGQSVEEVAARIAIYRAARRAAGHPGAGQVTLMLHAFVGDDEARVREAARAPLKAYLASSVDLIRRAAWSFPTFVQQAAASGRSAQQVMDERPLSPQEMDALLEHAFDRYWNTSALIGTPERCLALVQRLQDAGVDEIGCLIDFGIDADTVLAHLHHLRRLMALAQRPRRGAGGAAGLGIAGEMRRHAITHLQCTPSLATVLSADEEGRAALRGLQALLVGGEALPLPLARELLALVPGAVMNMYGPTETTVWSACANLRAEGGLDDAGFVPLGRPIANTRLHVRNAWGQECPALVPGELSIGGDGVASGYHARPELTAERFIPDATHPGARLYRTGDLARWHADGSLEFLGRLDHQVKIRGHRIELGEVENALAAQPGVREAVVLAVPGDEGQAALQAWVTPRDPEAPPAPQSLREALARTLPAVMVPATVVVRAQLARTPNGKVDRQALARQTQREPAAVPAAPSASPGSRMEERVAALWREVLGRHDVARDANFFDLGGHSLLVVQVQRRLREATGIEVAVADMFRLTTVAALARHLEAAVAGGADAAPPQSTAVAQAQGRAQLRRGRRAHSAGEA